MPFQPTFSCLWCGVAHATRSPEDLEGWAQLCPDCLGRAGDNPFLRFRFRDALAARAAEATATPPAVSGGAERSAPGAGDSTTAAPRSGDPGRTVLAGDPRDAEMLAYYEARAPEYDDWYLRRGRYAHGPIEAMAWAAELDQATLWLDGLPLAGRIVELAAGTGWWSPLLAGKGELWCYDGTPAPLELARRRLVAHGLRAHLHVRDAWADPEFVADGLFAGFWLTHIPRARLPAFLDLGRRWLRPGGTFAFIDSRADPSSSAHEHRPDSGSDLAVRRLSDGRTFTIPKIFHAPEELEAALREAGFDRVSVTPTSRFLVLGRATA